MTEAHKARNKRSYLKHVREMKCVTCGKQDERTLTGRVYCQECTDRHKANASPRKPRSEEQRKQESANKKAWKERLLALGACTQCGTKDKRTVKGMHLCVTCAAKKRRSQRAHWDNEKNNAYMKARRDAWRAQGLCTYCGGKREEPEKMLCVDCRVKARMREWARKRK